MSATATSARLDLGDVLTRRVIAVIRADTIADPVGMCRALAAGGITTIEFTFTTHGVEECVRAATSTLGREFSIGVGTVLTAEQAQRALDAGAGFLVTPCVRSDVAAAAAHRAPVLMGAMTPGEVLAAHDHGAAAVKIFPAGALGPRYIADLRGPFPHIPLVPSGGVNEANAAEFLAHGAAAVTAGTGVVSPQLVAAGDWAQITARAASFVASLHLPR
jgi:2-dehydro-3-deoxyphosphogluconate aldolase / (4S)-4-hydroxy-2-oxoglutarate aldolase